MAKMRTNIPPPTVAETVDKIFDVTSFEAMLNMIAAAAIRHYPKCRWASLVIDHGEGIPKTMITVHTNPES